MKKRKLKNLIKEVGNENNVSLDWKKQNQKLLLAKLKQHEFDGYQANNSIFLDLMDLFKQILQPARLIAICLSVFTISSFFITFASQDSAPGDNLYLVKRGIENIKLYVQRNPGENIVLHMGVVKERGNELKAIGNRYDDNQIRYMVNNIKNDLNLIKYKLNKLKRAQSQDKKEMVNVVKLVNQQSAEIKSSLEQAKNEIKSRNDESDMEFRAAINSADELNLSTSNIIKEFIGNGDAQRIDNQDSSLKEQNCKQDVKNIEELKQNIEYKNDSLVDKTKKNNKDESMETNENLKKEVTDEKADKKNSESKK